MTITDRITARIRTYPDWSPAEQRHMESIIEEILDHVRNGTGNKFIATWCTRYLADIISTQG